jgi:NAD(P)-dependent dehydrogenase (short-subunit alcohol dehydrogenase family)
MTDRLSLRGRVALVTGGSRGIGRAISLALADAGAAVAVNYRRDEAAAREVVERIAADGGVAAAYPASISDVAAIEALVPAVANELGLIDLLVSNAGIASRGQSLFDSEPGELARLMGVNVYGPHRLVQLVLPDMREQARGDIVFISSSITRHCPRGSGPYTIAKTAMEAMAFTLAKEERAHGVRVNVVAPGLVATEMGARLVRGGADMDIADLDAVYPFGRVSRPDDIAGAVLFLVSGLASYVSGQRLAVDGCIENEAAFKSS